MVQVAADPIEGKLMMYIFSSVSFENALLYYSPSYVRLLQFRLSLPPFSAQQITIGFNITPICSYNLLSKILGELTYLLFLLAVRIFAGRDEEHLIRLHFRPPP